MDPLVKELLIQSVRLSAQYAILNAHRGRIVQNELAEVIENTPDLKDLPAAIQAMLDRKITDAEAAIENAKRQGK